MLSSVVHVTLAVVSVISVMNTLVTGLGPSVTRMKMKNEEN